MSWKYLVLVALGAAACSTLPSGGAPTVAATPQSAAVTTIAGLSFGLPSADDLRAMAAYGFTGELTMPFRPSFYGATSTAKQLESGNAELFSNLPSPFGESWGTATVLTAHVPPGGADVAPGVQGTALPLVRAWADDGRLFTAYARMPNLGEMRAGIVRSHDPNATADEGAIVKNAGWPLAYVSEARHEALFFYQAGVVLHVRWSEKRFTEQNVPVTKEAAIKTVVAALRDPAAVCEEARTGLDHFLGVPYAGVFGPPTDFNRHDDFVPTYEVPDAVDWNGFLGVEFAEKPVWFINSTWGGGGMVDATTGALIRFTRLRVGHGTGGPPSPFAPPD